MAQIKEYAVEVRCDDDNVFDLPETARFVIDDATAQKIHELAALVELHDLYKVEMFDYRVQWLIGEGEMESDEVARTDANTLNITASEFWFAAYLKHTNIEILTEKCRISELLGT